MMGKQLGWETVTKNLPVDGETGWTEDKLNIGDQAVLTPNVGSITYLTGQYMNLIENLW